MQKYMLEAFFGSKLTCIIHPIVGWGTQFWPILKWEKLVPMSTAYSLCGDYAWVPGLGQHHSRFFINRPLFQWEFQDPKMEVLYHIRPYFWALHRPYIGLIYGRYLQFRILKWPLTIFRNFPWCLPRWFAQKKLPWLGISQQLGIVFGPVEFGMDWLLITFLGYPWKKCMACKKNIDFYPLVI